MAIFDRVLRAWRRPTEDKAMPNMALLVLPEQAKHGLNQPHNFSEYAAITGKHVWVYACIRKLSEAVASVPWLVYTDVTGEKTRVIDKGPLPTLLKFVNPFWDRWQLLYQLVWDLQSNGNAYLYLARDEVTGQVAELWRMDPVYIKIVPDAKKWRKGYIYGVNGKEKFFPVEDIIHVRYPHPFSDQYGLAPLAAADMSTRIDIAAQQSDLSLLNNYNVPPGIITMPGPLGRNRDESRLLKEEIQKRWDEVVGGASNIGKVHVMQNGATFKEIAFKPSDLQHLDLRRMTREEIAGVFQVPPVLVGILDHASLTNIREANYQFYSGPVIGIGQLIASTLNEQLVPLFDDRLRIEFDFSVIDALRQSDIEDRRVGLAEIAAGAKTINEYRRQFAPEEDPVPWGDAYWSPLNLTPKRDDEPVELAQNPNGSPEPLPAETPPKLGAGNQDAKFLRKGIDRERFMASFLAYQGAAEMALMDFLTPYLDRQCDEVIGRLEAKFAQKAFVGYGEVEAEEDLFDEVMAGVALWLLLKPGITGLYDMSYRSAYQWAEAGMRHGDWAAAASAPPASNIVAAFSDEVGLAPSVLTPQALMRHHLLMREVPIKTIPASMAQLLRASLAEGYEAGEGLAQLKERVRGFYAADAKDWMLERVARTETASAINAATLQGYKSGGIKYKEWMSARDPYVRDSHRAADGQVVPIDQDFMVGGFFAPCPGSVGIPREDINCRCVSLPAFIE